MVEFGESYHDAIQSDAGPSIKSTVAKQILQVFQGYGMSTSVIWRTRAEYSTDVLGSESSTLSESYHDTPITVIFGRSPETENTMLREQGRVDYGRIRAFMLPNQRYKDTDRHGIGWPHRLIKPEDLIFKRAGYEPHIFFLDDTLDRRYFYLNNAEVLENSERLYYYHTAVDDGNKVYLTKGTDYSINYRNGKITILKTWAWDDPTPKPINNTIYCRYDYDIWVVNAVVDREAYIELILKAFHY